MKLWQIVLQTKQDEELHGLFGAVNRGGLETVTPRLSCTTVNMVWLKCKQMMLILDMLLKLNFCIERKLKKDT